MKPRIEVELNSARRPSKAERITSMMAWSERGVESVSEVYYRLFRIWKERRDK